MTPERRFLLPWLTSAAVITIIRLLHATGLNYDATIQIQAAQNLLAGKGLTFYWLASDDLADPLALQGLTHYSAGYSLYAAALMAVGLAPATFVKIWGAVATLVGWWGWGRLAFTYMGGGEGRGRLLRFAAIWIAIVSPLLFTSRWGGTDIALWAAIPWVLMLITRAPVPGAQLELKLDVLGGFLIGVCVLARYASVFLLAYAVLVIVGQCRLRGALAAKRLAALGAGLLPGLAIQSYISFAMFDGPPPGGVSLDGERLAAVAARAWESVPALAAANQGVFFWLPGTLRFWTDNGYELTALALAGVVLIGLPLAFLVTTRLPVSSWFSDLRFVAAGMLVALPLFLWMCGLVGTYGYVGDRRYYEPLRPLAACIAYSLATLDTAGVHSRLAVVVRSSHAYLFAFVVMTAVEIGVAFVPTPRGDLWRWAMLGAEPRPWPSFQLTYEFSQARRFVLDLLKGDPAAVLITTRGPWFYAEPEADRSRVMRWEQCAASPHATHISGPVRFFILEEDDSGPQAPVRWPDQLRGRRQCWPELPGVKLVRRFPDERLRVLEADIPEGMTIPIQNPDRPGE